MSPAIAHNLVLSPTARVGAGVTFGANVVVHDGVVLGDGVVVEDGAILGKRPRLAASSAVAPVGDEPLVIGAGSTICAQAILMASAQIGAGTIIGDQAFVRERARVGPGTVVGHGSTIDNDVTVGSRVRIQTGVYLTGYSVVEDDVFVGPGVTTTNDDTMNRHADGYALRGAILRRACRIGGAAVLTPGVEVGEESFVAAGAVVTADIPARTLVMGVPARAMRRVADADLLERWR